MRPNKSSSSPEPHRRVDSALALTESNALDLSHEIEMPAMANEPDHAISSARHGHYAQYLEAARVALLAKFDCGDAQMQASGYVWPIIEMRMKYMAPLEFDQPVRIRATIVEWEHRLKIDYLISCLHTGRRLHKASSVQVALDMASRRMCWVSPPVLWEKLGVVVRTQ